jgi:hypothetical protein
MENPRNIAARLASFQDGVLLTQKFLEATDATEKAIHQRLITDRCREEGFTNGMTTAMMLYNKGWCDNTKEGYNYEAANDITLLEQLAKTENKITTAEEQAAERREKGLTF